MYFRSLWLAYLRAAFLLCYIIVTSSSHPHPLTLSLLPASFFISFPCVFPSISFLLRISLSLSLSLSFTLPLTLPTLYPNFSCLTWRAGCALTPKCPQNTSTQPTRVTLQTPMASTEGRAMSKQHSRSTRESQTSVMLLPLASTPNPNGLLKPCPFFDSSRYPCSQVGCFVSFRWGFSCISMSGC
ncbi:uncharacterized protein BP01DRAFT_41156 [Aspergillus saccharolyticus JOP 1030-1]|uniref:Uncharacterized protein n=1 Tax=Aspergillus saccharolyticus JOP 1030-1 TaxID=1450539 RepID=A0A319AF77_9EURO|nr:hypothetical protein BP01DRAFT_41156 [Aspergillus saccharolyticus JOP 1030-1]PYH45452.1 hypothetical protein BP01DRAFT_41156 [Aspergillus saccharolyticus JOP 1030-1]